MSSPVRPLFLTRRPYRRRRLVDASRMLPVFGFVLFMFPLFWGAGRVAVDTSPSLGAQAVFVFGVWIALVAAAAILARMLPRGSAEPDQGARPGEEDP